MKVKTRKKRYVVFAVALTCALLMLVAFARNIQPAVLDEVTIHVTRSGFEPAEVWVNKGATITFVSDVDTPFWPASNIHPFHTLYPAFDPQKPINPQDSWSFVIEEMGTWPYHDHIQPQLRGSIIVVDPLTGKNPLDCRNIQDLIGRDRERCWDIVLADAYDQGGISRAFDVFSRLYETDTQFVRSGCHQQAHRIGELVYAQYPNPRKIVELTIPDSAIACGYGFFHGLIEHMLRDRQDVSLARDFCEQMSKKYKDGMPRIRENCYHSAGHGFISDPPPTEEWGDIRRIVQSPLERCDALTDEPILRGECKEGTFNVVASWYAHSFYDIRLDPDDPFYLCRQFSDKETSEACYYEIAMIVHPLAQESLPEIHDRFVADIESDEIANTVINAVVAGFMERAIVEERHDDLIEGCYSLPARVHTQCIVGLSGGFVAHGEPGQEYVKALAFCANPALTPDDIRECYRNTLRALRGIYDESTYERVCSGVPAEYSTYCQETYL